MGWNYYVELELTRKAETLSYRMTLEVLCDRLRNGEIQAKREAGDLYGELCSKPLDPLSLKIIANSVADDEINRHNLHEIVQFWNQVPEHIDDDQIAYIWVVIFFNLFNGTEITDHLDLVGEVLGKWLVDQPETNWTSIALELLLKSTRYCESKSISLKLNFSVLTAIIMIQDFESANEILELSARVIGLNPDLEHHLAGNESCILQLLKLCKEIDDENYAWAIGLLGTISYSSEFEKTCDLAQPSNAIVQVLRGMIDSKVNGLVSIAGVTFGNLVTDSNKSQLFISLGYVDFKNFIDQCIQMTAVEKQAIHLLKNLSNSSEVTSTYLIPNGIIDLIENVLNMKVFPRLKSTAATLAKNILLTVFDDKLYQYLVMAIGIEEDTSVRNSIITAISTIQPDLVPDLSIYAKAIFTAKPPTTSSTKALATIPIPILLEKFEIELTALLKEYSALQDRGTQNNIAYLAAEIAKVDPLPAQLAEVSRDILVNYIKNDEQSR